MFKFNIGDVVALKCGEAESDAASRMGVERQPHAFTIVERLSQECPGGVQYHYGLGGDPHRHNEIELMLFSECDFSGRYARIKEFEEKEDAAKEDKYVARAEARRKARETPAE